jgi:hypothetical protein
MTYKRKEHLPNQTGVRTRYARDYLSVLLGFDGKHKGFYTSDLLLYEAAIKRLEGRGATALQGSELNGGLT